MWFLLACSSVVPESEAERPKLRVTPPRAEAQVVAPPAPAKPTVAPRAPVREHQIASKWDATPGPCEGCEAIVMRAQASTELMKKDEVYAASSATDGRPKTAWCGATGLGEQLSLAAPGPIDVKRIRFAGWNGKNPAVTEVLVTTDRSDRFVLELPRPSKTRWPDASGQPPLLEIDLAGIQFIQFEIRELSGRGDGCISEVMIEGTQSQMR